MFLELCLQLFIMGKKKLAIVLFSEFYLLQLNHMTWLDLQDFSSPVGRKLINKPSLPKPFLQLNGRPQTLLNQLNSNHLSPRTSKRFISAESGRQSWDLSRFVKTLFFFNEPPLLLRLDTTKVFNFILKSERKHVCQLTRNWYLEDL